MMQRGRILFFAAVAAVLSLSPALAADNEPAPPKPSVTALPPLDELTATRERPLFSATRRPAAAPEPMPAAPAPIAEATSFPFELVGIVLGPDIRIAVFRKGEATPPVEGGPPPDETRVKIGQRLGDWTVDEIAERFVVLHGGGKRVRLRLYNEKNAGIQVGRPDGEPEAAPSDQGDADHKQAGPAEEEKQTQVDEEIGPSESPKVVVPAPRTVARPPLKPGPGRPPKAPKPPKPPR